MYSTDKRIIIIFILLIYRKCLLYFPFSFDTIISKLLTIGANFHIIDQLLTICFAIVYIYLHYSEALLLNINTFALKPKCLYIDRGVFSLTLRLNVFVCAKMFALQV